MDRGKTGDEKRSQSKDAPEQKKLPEKKSGAPGVEHRLERAGGIDRKDSGIIPVPHKLERAGGIDRSDSGVVPAEHKLERSVGIDRGDSAVVPAEHKLERSTGVDRMDSDVVSIEPKLTRATGIEKMDSQEMSEEHSSEIACDDRLESDATQSYELLESEQASDEEFEIVEEIAEDLSVERNLEELKIDEPAETERPDEEKPTKENYAASMRRDLLAGRMFEVKLQFDHLYRLIAPNMKFYMRSRKPGQSIEETIRRRVTAADLNIDPNEIRKQNGEPKLVVDTGSVRSKNANVSQQQKPSKSLEKLLSESKWVETKSDVRSEGGVLIERRSRNEPDMETEAGLSEMIVEEAMHTNGEPRPGPSSENKPSNGKEEPMVTNGGTSSEKRRRPKKVVQGHLTLYSKIGNVLWEEEVDIVCIDDSSNDGATDCLIVDDDSSSNDALAEPYTVPGLGVASGTPQRSLDSDTASSVGRSYSADADSEQTATSGDSAGKSLSAATSSAGSAGISLSTVTSSGDSAGKSLSAVTSSGDSAGKSLSTATSSGDSAGKSLSTATTSGDSAGKLLTAATSSGDSTEKSTSSVGAVYSSDGPSELTSSSGVGDSTRTPSLRDHVVTESSGISAGSVPPTSYPERPDSPYPMPDKSTDTSQSSTGLLAYTDNTSSIELAAGMYEHVGRTTSPRVAAGYVVNVGSIVPEILVSASEPTTVSSAAPDGSESSEPTTSSGSGDSSNVLSSRPDDLGGRLGRRNAIVSRSNSDDTTASSIPLDTPDSIPSSVFTSRSGSTSTPTSDTAPEGDAPPADTTSPAPVGPTLIPPPVPPRNPKKN